MSSELSSAEGAGSSPLARGKLECGGKRVNVNGIIPACAGETAGACARSRAEPDHPRLRGGNSEASSMRASTLGSSPLARGKQGRGREPVLYRGIIPACAGETGGRRRAGSLRRDHPRLRGGNGRGPRRPNSRAGSSPLARGKPEMYRDTLRGIRIIPACAGETNQMLALPCQRPDHPRLRGGNASVSSIYFRMAGSSPLARGKQGPPLSGTANSRIIPACAGETGSKSSPE